MTGGAAAGDTGIPHGDVLIEFAESVLGEDEARLERARASVLKSIGAAALVDAAGVAGNFNAIDRIADATGTPLDQQTLQETEDLREQLQINRFAETRAELEAGSEPKSDR